MVLFCFDCLYCDYFEFEDFVCFIVDILRWYIVEMLIWIVEYGDCVLCCVVMLVLGFLVDFWYNYVFGRVFYDCD